MGYFLRTLHSSCKTLRCLRYIRCMHCVRLEVWNRTKYKSTYILHGLYITDDGIIYKVSSKFPLRTHVYRRVYKVGSVEA